MSKINSIRVQDETYDIDLPESATPTITSLTTTSDVVAGKSLKIGTWQTNSAGTLELSGAYPSVDIHKDNAGYGTIDIYDPYSDGKIDTEIAGNKIFVGTSSTASDSSYTVIDKEGIGSVQSLPSSPATMSSADYTSYFYFPTGSYSTSQTFLVTDDLKSKQDIISSTNKLSADYVDGLATVAKTGSYSDLTDKLDTNNFKVYNFTASGASNFTSANSTYATISSSYLYNTTSHTSGPYGVIDFYNPYTGTIDTRVENGKVYIKERTDSGTLYRVYTYSGVGQTYGVDSTQEDDYINYFAFPVGTYSTSQTFALLSDISGSGSYVDLTSYQVITGSKDFQYGLYSPSLATYYGSGATNLIQADSRYNPTEIIVGDTSTPLTLNTANTINIIAPTVSSVSNCYIDYGVWNSLSGSYTYYPLIGADIQTNKVNQNSVSVGGRYSATLYLYGNTTRPYYNSSPLALKSDVYRCESGVGTTKTSGYAAAGGTYVWVYAKEASEGGEITFYINNNMEVAKASGDHGWWGYAYIFLGVMVPRGAYWSYTTTKMEWAYCRYVDFSNNW